MAMGEREPEKSGVGNLDCHRFLTFEVRPERGKGTSHGKMWENCLSDRRDGYEEMWQNLAWQIQEVVKGHMARAFVVTKIKVRETQTGFTDLVKN